MRLSDLESLRHLELEGDFSGRTAAYHVRAALPALGAADVAAISCYLEAEGLDTVRLCLHQGLADAVHEMVIFQRQAGRHAAHKHLQKSESYHLVGGALLIETFDEAGAVTGTLALAAASEEAPFLCKIPRDVWHRTRPLTSVAVFKETRPGPFDGNDSVLAPWEPGST